MVRTCEGSGVGCYQGFNIFTEEEENKLSKTAEKMSEVNRNLAPDGCQLGTKQVEQT